MAEWDVYWLVSQGMNLLVFAVFFITLFLIPSKEKIRKHQAGPNLLKPTIPILLGVIFISSAIIAIAAFFLVEQKWIVLGTSGLIILANILLTVDFISTKKLYKEVSSAMAAQSHGVPQQGQIHVPQQHLHGASQQAVPQASQQQHLHGASQQAVPQASQQQHLHGASQQAVPQAPQQHHLPSAGSQNMMTVECPNCSGHIEIPEGSHEITCPYCGLSGSM